MHFELYLQVPVREGTQLREKEIPLSRESTSVRTLPFPELDRGVLETRPS